MLVSKRLAIVLAAAAWLAAPIATLDARTAKGDRLYSQGREAEQARDYDKALDLYEQALATSTNDVAYLMAVRRVRFQAGQAHADRAQKLRSEGKLEEALAEYQRAAAIDPSSPVAGQEIRRTLDMIELRDRQRQAGAPEAERPQPPGAGARRAIDERLAAVLSVPELKPIASLPQNLRINNQPARVMFETVCKLAGINVIFDQDFVSNTTPRSLELNNATLEEALNYISIMTRAFWKPISSNAIFVTQDTQQKRNEYEEQVAKIIYLNNAGSKEDITDVINGIRAMIPTLRMQPVTSQNALVIRGPADQVALVEMMVRNLDRPKAEVVVDVIVMEVNRSRSRDLALTPVSGSSSGISVAGGLTATGSSTSGETSASSGSVRLNRLGRLSSEDFSITLPGASLKALMSDSNTRILQAPQVRAIDNMKASLKIGDRQPYSTGGIQSLTTGTTASSLYNSFQYLDVGVNVDITPKIHGTDEVSLHIELDISSIKERIEIAGIAQPVVGQRKIVHDIRLREGEVNLLGGLVQEQETKAVGGVPGLSSIPLIRRLFTSENVTKTQSELLIALVPRIVRTPDLDDLSYKGIASGSMNTVRLTYASQRPAGAEPAAAKPDAAPQQPAPQAPAIPSAAPLPGGLPLIPQSPAAPAPPKPPVPQVRLTPEKVETQMGGTFSLNVQVENVNDLFSAPLRLKFDPNVLQLQEVTRGSFLAADGREVLFTRNIQNEAGETSIQLSRMPGNAGMSGSGSLVTLTFQVVGKGVTTIAAPQISFQDSRSAAVVTGSAQATVNIR